MQSNLAKHWEKVVVLKFYSMSPITIGGLFGQLVSDEGRLLRHLRIMLPAALGLLWALTSCGSSSFTGSSASQADTPAGTTDSAPGDTTSGPSALGAGINGPNGGACVSGDKINFNWQGDVKSCIVDQHKSYNFDAKTCMPIRQAQFTCDWANVRNELQKRRLLTDVLESDFENGAKLVSCGQSADSNRIVVQWVKPAPKTQVDCNNISSGGQIMTGCYTLWDDPKLEPPPPANDAEKRQQVFGCMNQL